MRTLFHDPPRIVEQLGQLQVLEARAEGGDDRVPIPRIARWRRPDGGWAPVVMRDFGCEREWYAYDDTWHVGAVASHFGTRARVAHPNVLETVEMGVIEPSRSHYPEDYFVGMHTHPACRELETVLYAAEARGCGLSLAEVASCARRTDAHPEREVLEWILHQAACGLRALEGAALPGPTCWRADKLRPTDLWIAEDGRIAIPPLFAWEPSADYAGGLADAGDRSDMLLALEWVRTFPQVEARAGVGEADVRQMLHTIAGEELERRRTWFDAAARLPDEAPRTRATAPITLDSSRKRATAGRTMVLIPSPWERAPSTHRLPFWADDALVSERDFDEFLRATGRPRRLSSPSRRPVVRVSWHEADTYAQWAGKRLPTEDEWERLARGPMRRVFWWGDRQPDRTWFRAHEKLAPCASVGDENEYGIRDLSQNVWEWTATPSPRGGHVVRGGRWRDMPQEPNRLTNASQEWEPAPDVGFRCVETAGS